MTDPYQPQKDTFRRFVEIWQDGRVEPLEAMVAPDYVGHTSSGDRDAVGLRQRILAFHVLYGDVVFSIEEQVASGNMVATRLTASAISMITGKPVRLAGHNMCRIADDRIAEEWPVWETILPEDDV